LCCLQAAENNCDTADYTSPSRDSDHAQSALLETAELVDKKDSSLGDQIQREDAKQLFGNGRLDRWLSKRRRAFNQPPKLKTLESWLSPSKTESDTLSPKRRLSLARTRLSSPEMSPVALRRKTSSVSVCLESLDPSRSPSADIRKYFRSRALPQSPSQKEHGPSKSDSEAESHLDAITVIDLVGDSPRGKSPEQSNAAVDEMASSQCEMAEAAPDETTVDDPSRQRNISGIHEMTDSESPLDWWATSRTKSSTRKGPFKRSLGLVHFLNEVHFLIICLFY